MQVPLQTTFRGVDRSPELDQLVEDQAGRLERFCDNVTSCRVAVENPHHHQQQGREYRVRIEVRVPPGHEVVVDRDTNRGDMHQGLDAIIRDAFHTAGRQLEDLVQQQRGDVKHHPAQQVVGVVSKKLDGYGFIKNVQGREVYFHENSVVNDDFANVDTGMGVAYDEEIGDEGAKATSVRVMDRRS